MNHYLGIDIGSVSVKCALVDESLQIIHKEYIRHHGQTSQLTSDLIIKITGKYHQYPIRSIAFTGNGAQQLAKKLDSFFVNEVIAQSKAMARLFPDVKTIIEIGGEDAKLIKSERDTQTGMVQMRDFAMNTVCAAGTGSFLDQQAQRLGISIEDEFGKMAVTSQHPPRIAGRCSVFAKSDMIHLQQLSTPPRDILMGLCLAMARNFRSNVAKGVDLEKPVAFIGGVASNIGMVKAFREVLGLKKEEFTIPEEHKITGALGAVIALWESDQSSAMPDHKKMQQTDAIVLQTKNDLPALHDTGYQYHTTPEPLREPYPVDVYLGVDIGSISTNLVLINDQKQVVARKYLMTAGNPLQAVKNGLSEMAAELEDKVKVRGVATTGSGRYLVGDFIGADVVKNEITAHATGAANVRPDVDTIFEIGGQDSKFISLKNGVVSDFTMNKVCAAGTGSFLEEQAEKLGISIKGEFSDLALRSQNPASLGERCTVFMESALNKHQQSGTPKEDLVAGLAYSVVKNYLSTVVAGKPIGHVILFQGGTAYNRAVKAAFEQQCGKKIIVPPHHDVLGALGCALIALENKPKGRSAFRGFNLTRRKLTTGSFICEDCSNSCEIRTVSLEGEKTLNYGDRCGKYEEKEKEATQIVLPDLFAEREKMLMSASSEPETLSQNPPLVAIPRSLLFYEQFPFWKAYFSHLGFKVVTSPASNKKIVNQGCEAVVEEVCFPVKVGLGHTIEALKSKPDYLFLPCVVNAEPIHNEACTSSICPLVQGFPYMSDAALDFSKYQTKILRPTFHFENGSIQKELQDFAKALGAKGARAKRAIEKGFAAMQTFKQSMLKRGEQILNDLPKDRPGLVVVSRPYNGNDVGLNLRIPSKLRKMGILAIPADFLPVYQKKNTQLEKMYWRFGQRNISAAHIVANNPALFALYITNFACGPDSFILKYFEKVMDHKPMLTLELDEHSADAGVVTRLEAFLDSLESLPQKTITITPNGHGKKVEKDFRARRKVYIPHIDDHGKGIAAAIRHYGIESEALPLSDKQSMELARKHVTGKECYPFMITAGDILKKTREAGFDPARSAFFMPTTNGPCRFGQYCHAHQMILDEAGFGEAQMLTIEQTTSFDSELKNLGTGFRKLIWQVFVVTDNIKKLLYKTRPYEFVKGHADMAYDQAIKRLENNVELYGSVGDSMKYAAGIFSAIKTKKEKNKPKIGIIGEIYVRSNDYCNNFIVKRLEELGAEVVAPAFHEWILYTDWERRVDHLRNREYSGYAKEVVTSFVQKYYTRRETAPLKGKIENFLYEIPTEGLMKLSEEYLTENLRGEATLSMARAEEYARHGFQGVVNLTPFHCMPGTIANTLLVRFSRKYPNIPVLKMVYDGSDHSADDTKLEAFMFQAKQLMEAGVTQ